MDFAKVAKVLALAASDNETEALAAIRMLKRLLEAEGKDFVALSQMLDPNASFANSDALADAVFDLRNEVRHVRSENERLRQMGNAFDGNAHSSDELDRIRREYHEVMAELDAQTREIEHLRNVESTLRRSFQEALSEANRAQERVRHYEARVNKLDADLQRMAMMNHALGVDLVQAKKAQRAAAVASVVVDEAATPRPKRPRKRSAPKPAPQNGARPTETAPERPKKKKAKPPQYALF